MNSIWMVSRDVLVGQSVVKAKERWKLHGDSTKHVLHILLAFSGVLGAPATKTVCHFKALFLLLVRSKRSFLVRAKPK